MPLAPPQLQFCCSGAWFLGRAHLHPLGPASHGPTGTAGGQDTSPKHPFKPRDPEHPTCRQRSSPSPWGSTFSSSASEI